MFEAAENREYMPEKPKEQGAEGGEKNTREIALKKRAVEVISLLSPGGKEKQDLGKHFDTQIAEQDISVKNLQEGKETVAKTRQKWGERYKDFNEAEKTMNYSLRDFKPEEKETLLQALDHKLNPETQKAEIDHPIEKKQEDAFSKVIEKLDTATEEKDRPAMHMAVYTHLLQDALYKKEDQLNADREDVADRHLQVAVAGRALTEEIKNNPLLAESLTKIASSTNSEKEKISSIHLALVNSSDPKIKDAAEAYAKALEGELNIASLTHRIAEGERSLRTDNETLSKMSELSAEEKTLAGLFNKNEAASQESIEKKAA